MTHVIDSANAAATRCGIERKTDEALPLVLARWMSRHAGYGMEVCPTCDKEGVG